MRSPIKDNKRYDFIDFKPSTIVKPAVNNQLPTKSDDLEVDGEFDIQLSIIKLKEKKKEKFYVKFDSINGSLIEISPIKIISSSVRNGVLTVDELDEIKLVKDLLTSKLATSAVKVEFIKEIGKYKLIRKINSGPKSRSILTMAGYQLPTPSITIQFNFIFKKVIFRLNAENYKNYISDLNLDEYKLFNQDLISFYFIDLNDYSALQARIDVSFGQLLETNNVEVSAQWLPDSENNLIAALYNTSLGFQVSIIDTEEPKQEETKPRPQILYKQEDSVLFVQSIMEKADNYKLRDIVNLFIYKYDDPGFLLGKIQVDKRKFDNFGTFNLVMNYKEKVRVHSDHSYLHIEDNDVSTYYKF